MVNKLRKLYLGILIFAIVVVVGASTLDYFSLEGFEEVNLVEVQGNVVAVGKDCKAIVATVSPERALYIKQGIDKTLDIRPNVYDIFDDTLRGYNITLESVKILSMNEGIYYGQMMLKQGNKILKIDARPSDAIALALRTDSKIFINSTLLKNYGVYIC
jgi:bifunctional DNase/RNase